MRPSTAVVGLRHRLARAVLEFDAMKTSDVLVSAQDVSAPGSTTMSLSTSQDTQQALLQDVRRVQGFQDGTMQAGHVTLLHFVS